VPSAKKGEKMNRCPRVLITGGAGYIGSVLVHRLLLAGYKVRVLDNFKFSQTSLLGLCHDPNLHIIRGDVRDEDTMMKAVEGADFIIPLAAIVGVPACAKDFIGAESTNVGAIRILTRCRSDKQKIIFPCTNSGYGIGEEGIYCTEETPLRPISLYGKEKVAAEQIILKAGNSISLRLATTFGISAFMRLDLLVNNFVYRAVTDGFVVLYQADFKRNYIHVQDVAKVFVHCIRNFDRVKNEVYNVGLSDANISKRELCEEIKKQVPDFYFVESEIGEDPDQRNYLVSNAKIEATGYKPDVSLQEGIAELIKGYKIIGTSRIA